MRFAYRTMLLACLALVFHAWSAAHGDSQDAARADRDATKASSKRDSSRWNGEKIVKTNSAWGKQLTREQYNVTRRKGTERAFSGRYWNNKRKGIYACVCCDLPLFHSSTKFDSGTGWPSFWNPVEQRRIVMKADRSYFTVRTEVKCARCDAHLGHVFADGPRPTGRRYCINSVSLDFEASADKSREKRAQ